jgi:lipopolysaccharide export system permease protein
MAARGGIGVKIIDRYLARQFLWTFLLLVLALPFLFLITDLTDNLDRYLARGLGLRAVAISYVYFIPQLVFWGFPIAALIATVCTIGNMTRHQEITAAKAGGVSFYRLAAPIVLLASLLSVVAVGIGEVVPVSNQKKAEVLGERETFASPFRTNFVFRTEDGKTLAATRLNVEARTLYNLVVESPVGEGGFLVHQSASNAVWRDSIGWRFDNGHVRWISDDGTETAFRFLTMEVPSLEERPEELLTAAKNPEEMTYAELERFIATLERSGGNTSEFRVKLAQKVSLPLALLVIVLFGAPLATTSQRGGTAFGIGISLAVTMVYLMMFKVGEAVGTSGAIPPLVAAWAPNALFLAAGLVLLARVRT